MGLVAGASRFLNQSIVSNRLGLGGQSSNLLSEVAGTATLLDVGRLNSVPGIGLSSSARSLNKQFLQSTSGTYNQLFSSAGGGSSTVEAAQTQIRALSSTVPTSRDTPQTREALAEAAAERGSIVDETA